MKSVVSILWHFFLFFSFFVFDKTAAVFKMNNKNKIKICSNSLVRIGYQIKFYASLTVKLDAET